ncbi:85/88 kDa calcium-independent phospholipase A2-like [Amphibalanus amphitrite]|uniref:85/88 kDa calcium-independent phospholipase A2-like n=1 Tax=Amphibalanus amphitrite TaxID=1232801 RepID=UPI001C927BDF|nr:85/88 kDa calcium-independent phospholipase A2-like [Amphibalanus amphitrite]XP_043232969.1 85/88 kDa calcium-independent phospholipase A2-like [Amphibalanus amphitrite]XP_043232970.1 85/88 kDa calcium-independent phospholipase A2-like [Amphibalanus amphitrite]XP_043232971.1 85/88 kDa calcium-independent phospholipase A2-like [Amphibalanus amphitrite]XP_043232972.1 85/88 kDa calcium-independent phospholipase A2-like [Amphibalanus amphitrite]
MSLFTNLVTDFLRDVLGANNDPNSVYEVKADAHHRWPVSRREECLCLYGPEKLSDGHSVYDLVLQRPLADTVHKEFVLWRTGSHQQAVALLERLARFVPLLVRLWPRETLARDTLQRVCDAARQHAGWHGAHVCAWLQWAEPLAHAELSALVSEPDPETGVTVLHLAAAGGQLKFVQRLMAREPPPAVDVTDADGNSPLHMAARGPRDVLALLLESATPEAVNARNKKNLTPLHIACMEDKPDNVKTLLKAGADVNVAGSAEELPIHTAMSLSSSLCAKEIIETYPNQLNAKDMKQGGTPLHWAKGADVMVALLELGCNVNAQNFHGDTALHVMTRNKLLDNVVLLLSHGAEVDPVDRDGNTPLHLAVAQADVHLTRALIVFGADLSATNTAGETPRHRAATLRKNADLLVYTLHAVGAPRCVSAMRGCREGCISGGEGIGVPPFGPAKQRARHHLDEVLAANTLSRSAAELRRQPPERPCRVLCLDGGGIRGILLVQALHEIQRLAGKPVIECFDWIGGTSVGGILAMALAIGKSLQECHQLFFRLKDKVFVGSRPYSNEKLESFLKAEFGESTTMGDIKKPRVIVTGVLGDRHPADLHLFRNYDDTASMMNVVEASTFTPPPPPSEQLLWRAARSSGAAPTFFRASGRFVDGGLIANNPTLDVLTEIFEHNLALSTVGRAAEVAAPTAVLSVGCGRPPVVEVSSVDCYTPDSIWDLTKVSSGVQALFQMVVEQATSVENRVVDRARAWCGSLSIPYLRCSPQLTLDLPLDETRNEQLLQILWESRVYLETKRDTLREFVKLLQ